MIETSNLRTKRLEIEKKSYENALPKPGHNKQEKAWHKLLSRPIITTKDLQEIENFKREKTGI